MLQIPVYQRGGTIIPKKDAIRQTATLMRNDPFTLIVCLDQNEKATGTLYVDDEQSFAYRQGQYLYHRFVYADGRLRAEKLDAGKSNYDTVGKIKKIVVVGMAILPKKAEKLVGSAETALEFSVSGNVVTVDNIDINVKDTWTVTFSSANMIVRSTMLLLSVVILLIIF